MVILVVHYIFKRNFTPQSNTSNKDKCFTLIGLTTLIGKSLICCVIFKSEIFYSQTENGIDFTVKVNNNSDNKQEFIEDNAEHKKASFEPLTGEGELFTEGPTCMFDGGQSDPLFYSMERIRKYVFYYSKRFFETTDSLN